MMSQNKYKDFCKAKEIAFTQELNTMRKAKGTDFYGVNFNGKYYVLCAISTDIENPDIMIHGMVGREVFDGFTIMSK